MIIEFLKNWKNIDGRLDHKRFWRGFFGYSLFILLLFTVAFTAVYSVQPNINDYLTNNLFASICRNIFLTVITIPLLTAIVRRVNDTGISKTVSKQYMFVYIALSLIPGNVMPFATWPLYLFALFFCHFKKNQFGEPDAKYM